MNALPNVAQRRVKTSMPFPNAPGTYLGQPAFLCETSRTAVNWLVERALQRENFKSNAHIS